MNHYRERSWIGHFLYSVGVWLCWHRPFPLQFPSQKIFQVSSKVFKLILLLQVTDMRSLFSANFTFDNEILFLSVDATTLHFTQLNKVDGLFPQKMLYHFEQLCVQWHRLLLLFSVQLYEKVFASRLFLPQANLSVFSPHLHRCYNWMRVCCHNPIQWHFL